MAPLIVPASTGRIPLDALWEHAVKRSKTPPVLACYLVFMALAFIY